MKVSKAEQSRRDKISKSMKKLFRSMTPKEKSKWSENRRGLKPSAKARKARADGLRVYYENLGEDGRKGRGWKGAKGKLRREAASKLLSTLNNDPTSKLRKGVRKAAKSGKTSEAAKASHNTEEFKILRSEISKAVWEDQRDLMLLAVSKRSKNKKWRKNQAEAAANPERNKKISDARKAWWLSLTDAERNSIVSKVLANSRLKPNKIEKALFKFLKQHGYGYRYVGNGKFFIGRKCPDFVDKKNNRLIEIDGSFWHDKEKDKKRNKIYVANGWRVLCLSYYDVLADDLKKIIENFHRSDQDIVQSARRRAGK